MKFILLSSARTGSNLLSASIRQNSPVVSFGEIAKEDFAGEPDAFRYISRLTKVPVEELRQVHATDVERFIYQIVFRISGAPAVGFKMFYEHCRSPQRSGLWKRLISDDELKVIHLTRTHLLEMYVSLRYAATTGRWTEWIRPGKNIANPANDAADIELNSSECESYFTRYEANVADARRSFAQHSVLEIEYEDLVQRPLETVNRARSFVGAAALKEWVSPALRQSSRRLEDKVSNYTELRNYFRGSKWAYLFDDQKS